MGLIDSSMSGGISIQPSHWWIVSFTSSRTAYRVKNMLSATYWTMHRLRGAHFCLDIVIPCTVTVNFSGCLLRTQACFITRFFSIVIIINTKWCSETVSGKSQNIGAKAKLRFVPEFVSVLVIRSHRSINSPLKQWDVFFLLLL